MTPRKDPSEKRGTSAAAGSIPENLQKPIRDRLKLARTARGIALTDIKNPSPGTIGGWERNDFSTVTFGKLYLLGGQLGFTFDEFLRYLVPSEGDVDAVDQITEEAKMMSRISVLLRSVGPEGQELILDMLRRLVDYLVNAGVVENAPIDSNNRRRIKRLPPGTAQIRHDILNDLPAAGTAE